MSNVITGQVVRVLDDYHLVINRGFADNVTPNCRFLIYRLGDELMDPETGESLGKLEIVCGEGIVDHIQARMTTLKTGRRESQGTQKIIKRTRQSDVYSILRMAPLEVEEISTPEMTDMPFENVEAGCLVRQI